MPEKNPTLNTSYSFEQLLDWFGRFTPQFKFRLQGFRRELDTKSFDAFVRDTLAVFRAVIVDLARVPKGPARARRVYALVDAEFQASPPTGVSCASGCSACCRSFPKQITDDEADLLAELIATRKVVVDTDELLRQSQASDQKAPCVFLDGAGRCSVYSDRPAVCRKYHVTSPRRSCESETESVIPRIDLMPELIVSAAMSLPDNKIDMMAKQLAVRLARGSAAS